MAAASCSARSSEMGPQFFEVRLLVSEAALDVRRFALLSGEPIFSFIQRLLLLPEPHFVGLPLLGKLSAEFFTCFIELRQHLLPLLDEATLGIDFALVDVGLPIQERPLPLGGFANPLVQSGAFFRQLLLPRVESFAASGERLLLLIKLRGSGIKLLVAALTSLP